MSLIGKELSGVDFNKIYKGIKFYRFLNNNLTHYGFKYKIGLNVDVYEFNPDGECQIGGLYFCEESKCYLFCTHYGNKVALIEIPDDARVWIENDKFKADKLIVTDIIDFVNMPDTFWINIAPNCGIMLQYVKDLCALTEDTCVSAVKHYGLALEYVIKQTEEICALAVQQNGLALQFVKDQYLTKVICILAVQQNSGALKYVPFEFKVEEVWKHAVQQDGFVDPSGSTKAFEKSLLSSNGNALKYVTNQTEELCILAVQQNGLVLRHVINQTEAICKIAVQQNGKLLYYVKEQTNDICALAVQQNGDALQYVINQTERICAFAVQQDGLALYYVNDQTEIICTLAVRQNGLALKFVKEQTNELCRIAVQQCGNALQYVKNQTPEICALAVQQDKYALAFAEEQFKPLFI